MVRGSTLGDDIGKIFVGGLSHETTQESLKSYFSSFGEVTDVVVMRDTVTKKPRGFGFVTFQDPNSVHKVLNHPGSHVVDKKPIDPKQAVPRGPGQAGSVSVQPSRDNNEMKIFVGGIANGTTEEDLSNYFSAYGKVIHVNLMYEHNQPDGTKRMRGFGFVTFDSSLPVEKTANIHYHQINGKTVEVKRAEKRDSKAMGAMQGMGGYQQQHGGHPGYGAAAYAQTGPYGMQHPIGMGRGFPSYGAMGPGAGAATSGFAGAPGPSPAYGYGTTAPGVPTAYDPNAAAAAMYGRSSAAGYGTGYGGAASVATQQASASGAGAPGGYPDYSRMQVSQAGQPGAAAGAPHVDSSVAPDYSAYGLGNYQQQQDLQYGPTRTSYSTESNFAAYGSAEPTGYTGAAAPAYGETFGRGTAPSRGFHPYGR
ncbi:RNA-binding protein Musashi homolog 2-like [Pocillopora verrucosa]|uniref:RNA-binding protein Musashi homolog 2-like n=1 Tax=Pocillopora verrucosa TaxID=203993 RepID=UPI00333E9E6A